MKLSGAAALVLCAMAAFAAGYFVGAGAERRARRAERQAQTGSVAAQPPFGWHHHFRVAMWTAFPSRADVVIVGDSTAELGEWRALLRGMNVANRGVSGDTSAAVLSRLDTINSVQPRVAVLLMGLNDIQSKSYSVKKTSHQFNEIVGNLRNKNIRVVVISTPLTQIANLQPLARALNSHVKDTCAASQCEFLDLNARLAEQAKVSSAYTGDGIHLSPAAYEAIAGQLLQILDPTR